MNRLSLTSPQLPEDDRRRMAVKMRDELSRLHPALDVEDACDEDLPWFALELPSESFLLEFAPSRFSVRTYGGLELLAKTWDTFEGEGVVEWFSTVLRGVGSQGAVLH
jgi:hypothetical protein